MKRGPPTPPLGVLRTLGELSTEEFTARYWQRRALCVRQALGDVAAPIDRAQLFALARDPQVESRLVTSDAPRWHVRHGPFGARVLPALRRPGWTLLVQGVDLHLPVIAALAARFRFLPAARFDDVMISYASDGGGVGPHVDQYDVFLLQAQGQRRWRIARHFDPQLRGGLPLRILANFRHEQEYVLAPGDLLYLPPGVAHEGVAQGECITISIGFRLPVVQEVADTWQEHQARLAPRPERIADDTRAPTRRPARLPAQLIDATRKRLRQLVPTQAQARGTLLEHLTEPKPTVIFEAPSHALAPARFAGAARRHGIRLDLRTRMLYAGGQIGINGELAALPATQRPLAQRLADVLRLSAGEIARASEGDCKELLALLHAWYCHGWIHLGAK